MSVLLRIAAVASLAWAVLLFGMQGQVIVTGQLSPVGRAVANGLAISNLVFAYIFWYAARAPAANRGVIYGAIVLMAFKTANDLYELLVLLPGNQALASLADLVLSVALLVGMLEALPRTLAVQQSE
ncbi:MAG: hypothetical protein ACE5I7_15240 [Candidatus Binatia bacterium]